MTQDKSKAGIISLIISLVLAAFLFYSCPPPKNNQAAGKENSSKTENNAKAPEKEKKDSEETETIFAVDVVEAVQGELNNYIKINGDVVAETNVSVYPDTAGKLVSILVEIGTPVYKGQIIAYVDPSRPGMRFSASPVKAPIGGTVTSISGQLGMTVGPQMPIAKVGNLSRLEISCQIPERFISKIQKGQDAILSLQAYPDKKFPARVSEISPVLDPLSRTMEIKLDFSNREGFLKPGMFCEVKIITERKKGIVKLPAKVLVRRFGGTFAFVLTDGKVEKRPVTAGIEIDGKLEIVEGLKAGEKIVVRGQSLLEDGAAVRVIDTIKPLPQSDQIE